MARRRPVGSKQQSIKHVLFGPFPPCVRAGQPVVYMLRGPVRSGPVDLVLSRRVAVSGPDRRPYLRACLHAPAGLSIMNARQARNAGTSQSQSHGHGTRQLPAT